MVYTPGTSQMVNKLVLILWVIFCFAHLDAGLCAHEVPSAVCPRPSPGNAVPEPDDLRSQNGLLKVSLTIRNYKEADGSTRYCYISADGSQSPNLRVHPGDLLI